MAVYEQSTLLRCKDNDGNEYLLYPITKLDCVDGAEDLVHYDKDQELTAVQKAQFLKNIGGLCAPVSAQTNQFLKVSAVDENGNVTAVETSEVQTEISWDNVQDKPFGNLPTGSDTLYWNGNREGLIQADGYTSYLISESVPTLADFENGASYTYLQSGNELSANLGMGTAIYEAGDGCIVVSNTTIALKDGATLGDVTYPKKGTYFTWIGNNAYTTSLTINGYNGFPSEKQLDEKWLPHHTHDLGPTPITTSGTGEEYTVTIDGITELYNGLQFIMLPHTNSTTTSVKLNVNGLGAKLIRQRLGTNTSIGVVGATDNWIVANKPVTVTYNGTAWMVELARPDANNLYGTVGIDNGGTGASTVEAARENLNVYSKEEVDNIAIGGGSFEQVQSDWKQSDSTQADYIKNKPFSEIVSQVDILPLARYENFILDSTFGLYKYDIQTDCRFTVGEHYKVSWDGEEYTCEALDASELYNNGLNIVAFGNGTAFGYPGNNEPFIMTCNNDNGYMTFVCLTHTEPCDYHDVRVYQEVTSITQIDSKYIPTSDLEVSWNNIQDKPFYDDSVITEILAEQTLSGLIESNGMSTLPVVHLNVGTSYIVIFDGEEYDCVAREITGDDTRVIFIGNGSVAGLDDTGEPFTIMTDSAGTESAIVMNDNSVDTRTVAVYCYEDILLAETTYDGFTLDQSIGMYEYGVSPPGYNLILGKTYIVEWDGICYTCVAQDLSAMMSGAIGLGNLSAFGGVGNDEPFAIGWTEFGISYFSFTEGTTHTIMIRVNNIKTLDEKFLPMDAIDDRIKKFTGTSLPEITAADAGKFLRVSSEGTWELVSILNAEEASF